MCDKGWLYNEYSWTNTACVVLASVELNDEGEISTDVRVPCGRGAVSAEWSVEGCLLGRRVASAKFLDFLQFVEGSGPWSSRCTR